uniref:FZ domain-containing protein n=1 Tax=Salarias fasciatus TaxID=181472 RepID=A0A672G9U4_SALFA
MIWNIQGGLLRLMTIFPNILGHRTRSDAESGAEYLLLSVIHGLLNGECSPEIRLVGCSVLASPCQDNKMIKPCRSTCEALRKDCSICQILRFILSTAKCLLEYEMVLKHLYCLRSV